MLEIDASDAGREGKFPPGADIILPAGTWRKTRALAGLKSIGCAEIAEKIRGCKDSARCGNPYCKACRSRMIDGYGSRVLKHVDARYGANVEEANENLRFFTILFDWVDTDPASVQEAVAQARKDIKRLKRIYPELFIQGAFDFEMVDVQAVLSGKRAWPLNVETMVAIGGDKIFGMGHAICVHAHGILDANGREVRLDRVWNEHPRQTDLKCLYENRTSDRHRSEADRLSYNVKKISEYLFKNSHRYKFEFRENQRANGPYFTNRRIGELARIYSSCSGNGYNGILIHSGCD